MIYFDNSATTKVSEEVLNSIIEFDKNYYANPSSLHRFGFEVEQKLKNLTENISSVLNIGLDEICFTSGATESNNLAILGVAEVYKKRGNRLITTKIEHPSVLNTFLELEKRGFEVIYLNVDEKGYINEEELLNFIDNNTILISIMYVNNEIGTIQNIDKISSLVKSKNKDIIFHTDAVQAFGKLKISVKNIDLMSVSGHKLHSQKGIGFLYIKKGVRLANILFGAGQQNNLRAGTINSEGIVGISTATRLAYENIDENFAIVEEIKKEICNLKSILEGVYINGDEEKASPYILSLSFEGVKGEVLLHALEERDIFVSTGAACNSKNRKTSVLDYINKEYVENTIRVSFSSENTLEEAKIFNKTILEIVPFLRAYQKR